MKYQEDLQTPQTRSQKTRVIIADKPPKAGLVSHQQTDHSHDFSHFQMSQVQGTVMGFSDLFRVEYKEHREAFETAWDSVLFAMV